MNIITLQEYKAAKALTDDPKQDAKIQFLIDSVSNLIKAYIGANFSEGGKTVTETISVDYETNQVFLENYPVDAIISVVEPDRYTTDSSVHVPLVYASDYVLNGKDGILTRIYKPGGFANWPISPGFMTVTYLTGSKWGSNVTPADLPADLKLAAILLVDYYKAEEYRQSKSVQSTSIVNTLAAGEDFPQHIQVLLDRYKK